MKDMTLEQAIAEFEKRGPRPELSQERWDEIRRHRRCVAEGNYFDEFGISGLDHVPDSRGYPKLRNQS